MAILIIEDDDDLLDVLSYALRRRGYDVLAAHDGPSGLRLWESKDPELVLLDAGLPQVSGWEICRRIRAEASTPIIMLSGATTEVDVVRGLDLGADDYIGKPVSPRVLVARVQAVLRRAKEATDQPRKGMQCLSAGDLTLDPQWRQVRRGNESIHLTAIEFKLLYELVLHEGQVLTHQLLGDRVWGYDAIDESSLIKGHIRNLRRKLETDTATPAYVQTVAGVGYTFCRQAA